eukprot:TRINITY_DN676_c0_g4_i2.p1 TRINITY_DN676_c0_g4~~TRINITY_DN676_c0_g4_i2.p1  ORF type:complete len:127 (-),score=10.27 TRINITY_DN676_c0_g4_i2:114-494(-)
MSMYRSVYTILSLEAGLGIVFFRKLNVSRKLADDVGLLLQDTKKGKEKGKENKKDEQSKLNIELRTYTRFEAMSFSVVYNNALFLTLVLFFGFYIFKALPDSLYPSQFIFTFFFVFFLNRFLAIMC